MKANEIIEKEDKMMANIRELIPKIVGIRLEAQKADKTRNLNSPPMKLKRRLKPYPVRKPRWVMRISISLYRNQPLNTALTWKHRRFIMAVWKEFIIFAPPFKAGKPPDGTQ